MNLEMEVRASKDLGVRLTSSLIYFSVHRKLIDARRSLFTSKRCSSPKDVASHN